MKFNTELMSAMGAVFPAGGFSIKLIPKGVIDCQRSYPGIRNDQKATISDKQYDLDRINAPALILHALDDRLVDYDFAKYAHAHIPDSEIVTFPSGGHVLLGTHEQYREVVAGFLKKHL